MPAPKDPEKRKLWLDNLSKTHKGNPKCHPPGWGEKVSNALTGRERTIEHCENISKAKKGKTLKPRTESHCKAISDSLKGKKKSEIHRKNLSAARMNLSDTSKNNMSIAAKNRFLRPEYVERFIMARLGKIASDDTKIRMVESHIGGFWYGNIKYYDSPYCEKWTANLRERVRAYFGYRCFECGIPQNGRKHSVHHIHYNKKTCCDGSPHDMVPLCPECHSKANFDRDYWEDHYTELLYASDPDGKCFFTREEMREFTHSLVRNSYLDTAIPSVRIKSGSDRRG